MIHMEWLFLMQLMMGSLMIVFLHKQIQMKKQLDEMTKEVTNYISYITEDMTEETTAFSIEESLERGNEWGAKKKRDKEEAQNRLIQAVLGEYFP